MSFKPLVTVAGTAWPEPATYNGTTSTLVDAGRNVGGFFIGSVLRDDIAKVEATWRFLTVEQWAAVLAQFNRRVNGKFINSVTFLDQATGEYETREMYVSDRTAGAWLRDHHTKELRGWTNCRIALIEV